MASLSAAKRLVIKIGSALLVDRDSGALREDWLKALAADVAWLKEQGKDVILVSSGSIALGRRVLNLPQSDLALEQSQAAAAVGQIRLARAYQEALTPYDITTGQVLVTLEDSENRRRYLNTRATLNQLIGLGVVPIVNENDTVATDEIRYGDNDRLAAQVAVTVGADQLILLSDVDGFYSANPQQDANAQRFDVIENITPEIEAMAGGAASHLSRGGMVTKIEAAKMAVGAGTAMVICEGAALNPLSALFSGGKHSYFMPNKTPRAARKNWITASLSAGTVHIDAGALTALGAGKSLLPIGVTKIEGNFQRGDAVTIVDPANHEVARGLASFDSLEANSIVGKRSDQIVDILGPVSRTELVHRDNLVLTSKEAEGMD